MTRPKWAGTQNSQNCLAYLKEEVLRQGFRSPLSDSGNYNTELEESVYAGSQCFRKVSRTNRRSPLFWDLFMLTVQCYKSNSPESRDFIRLEVGPSLVCLAIGKIYGRSSVPPNLYVIFAR